MPEDLPDGERKLDTHREPRVTVTPNRHPPEHVDGWLVAAGVQVVAPRATRGADR